MPFLLFSKKYFRAGAETDCGLKRTENQDAYRCLPARGLFIVSDGMGGGEGGRRAAEMVVRILEQAVAAPMKHLSGITKFAHQANAEIRDYAKEHHLRGMGATIAGILLSAFRPEEGILFSAGDSRCYRLRNGILTQLTTDHTIASAMGVGEETLAKHLQAPSRRCLPSLFRRNFPAGPGAGNQARSRRRGKSGGQGPRTGGGLAGSRWRGQCHRHCPGIRHDS